MKELCVFVVCNIIPILAKMNATSTEEFNTDSGGPTTRDGSGFDTKVFALAFGLAHIPLFTGIAVAIVIGVYCCYFKRKKGSVDLAAMSEKGGLVILDDKLLRAKEEGRLTVNVAILENGKPSQPNHYSKEKESLDSLEKSTHIKDQSLPSVPVSNGNTPSPQKQKSTPTHESSSKEAVAAGDHFTSAVETSDGYALLSPENFEDGVPDETGYVEVTDADTGTFKYDVSHDLIGGGGGDTDEHDYEEPYWEPASKEEELMVQLSKLNVPVIAAEDIEMKDHLGSGQFGTVYSGVWSRTGGFGKQEYEVLQLTEVAVKSMKHGASEEERTKFLQEAAIMGQFKHSYILRILGYMTGDPLKIVVEVMQKGDLHQHLLSLRPDSGKPVCSEMGAVLLSYTRQIALGMGYLTLKQYVHRDLAARNVLVSDEGICKIADFGLSRDLQNEDYYVSHGGKVPVKWTAPEALHYRKYSTASDVWSYGCLLYEIWSLGCKPFHDLTNAQAMQKVASGYRLPPPPGCPRSIYKLMVNCWHPTASSRPGFCDMVVSLQHPDFQVLKWTQKDIDSFDNENARVLGAPLEAGYCLYRDLQNKYKKAIDHNSQEVTQKVDEVTDKESSPTN